MKTKQPIEYPVYNKDNPELDDRNCPDCLVATEHICDSPMAFLILRQCPKCRKVIALSWY